MIWSPRTTGLWQTVWHERFNPCHIGRLRWAPKVETSAIGFEIGVEIGVEGASFRDEGDGGLWVDVAMRARGRVLACDRYLVVDGEVDRIIVLADPGIDDFRNELFWSPERPTLNSATVSLYRCSRLVDRVES